MEEIKNMNSCVMLAANLSTPVLLNCVFDSGDLKDTGIQYDSHVTLLYARDKKLGESEVLSEVQGVRLSLGMEAPNLTQYLSNHKSNAEFAVPVFDVFELDIFENDSDYVVLKVKEEGNIWYDTLVNINKELSEKFGVVSDFSSYTPHLTLAELEKGTARSYVGSESLRLILEDSTIHFEDIILSYGREGVSKYDVIDLTTNCSVDRFFRVRQMRKEAKRLDQEV